MQYWMIERQTRNVYELMCNIQDTERNSTTAVYNFLNEINSAYMIYGCYKCTYTRTSQEQGHWTGGRRPPMSGMGTPISPPNGMIRSYWKLQYFLKHHPIIQRC